MGPALSISRMRARYFSVREREEYWPDLQSFLRAVNRDLVEFEIAFKIPAKRSRRGIGSAS
jgi:hypothetical protein